MEEGTFKIWRKEIHKEEGRYFEVLHDSKANGYPDNNRPVLGFKYECGGGTGI